MTLNWLRFSFDMTPRVKAKREKKEKLKFLLFVKHSSENEQVSHRFGENICKSYIRQKDMYPDYTKNSQNSRK